MGAVVILTGSIWPSVQLNYFLPQTFDTCLLGDNLVFVVKMTFLLRLGACYLVECVGLTTVVACGSYTFDLHAFQLHACARVQVTHRFNQGTSNLMRLWFLILISHKKQILGIYIPSRPKLLRAHSFHIRLDGLVCSA